jgi:8-oxo-dGTP diphosphatase
MVARPSTIPAHGFFMQSADSSPPRPLVLVVAAALVDDAGRVLIAQRPEGKSLAGLWEFPGGKVEPGEGLEEALVRELREELDIEASPDAFEPFAFASHGYPEFNLVMPLYLVREWRGTPQPLAAQALAWALPSELSGYPMPPADAPLLARLVAAEPLA